MNPMTRGPAQALAIREMITQTDYFRGLPRRPRERAGYKEWQHFIIHGPELELLINFSYAAPTGRADAPPRDAPGVVRLIVLARRGGWRGAVERYEERAHGVELRGGQLTARLGPSEMSFDGRGYRLRVDSSRLGLAAEFSLEPLTTPALSSSVPLAPRRHLSWLIVPRLAATGTVSIDGERILLTRVPAYHDHNWGQFFWGEDFAWEWGSCLPSRASCPWSAVFARMSNRARTRVSSQGLFVWRDAAHSRFFRDRDLRVTLSGKAPPGEVLKLPSLMATLFPGTASDVPRALRVEARADKDAVTLEFETRAVSQILIPDERDSETLTLLNEASGVTRLTGTIQGERVELEGHGVFEFIRPE